MTWATWRKLALRAIRATCRRLRYFISDDVWRSGLPSFRNDRMLGAVMKEAQRLGLCRPTRRLAPSIRSHGSGKPVWRSLVTA